MGDYNIRFKEVIDSGDNQLLENIIHELNENENNFDPISSGIYALDYAKNTENEDVIYLLVESGILDIDQILEYMISKGNGPNNIELIDFVLDLDYEFDLDELLALSVENKYFTVVHKILIPRGISDDGIQMGYNIAFNTGYKMMILYLESIYNKNIAKANSIYFFFAHDLEKHRERQVDRVNIGLIDDLLPEDLIHNISNYL